MHDYSDEQLLALIEGELDAEEAAHLRRSIEQSDPALASRLEAMAADRAALRDLPPVDPPIDFLAEIEPMIARPMLMETVPAQPGAARRAHHRRQRRVQLVQAAVAAVVVLGVSVAILLALDATGVFNGHSTPVAAQPDFSEPSPAVAVNDADNHGDEAIGEGQLHHKLPALGSTGSATQRVADADVRRAPGQSSSSGAAAPEPVEVDFALVVSARDRETAEAALSAALPSHAGHTALVRNLSVDELGRIERQWLARRAAAGQPVREPLYADVDTSASDNGDTGARRPRLPQSMLSDNAEQLVKAGLVAGDQRLMPPYSRQIELSESGAAYTIAVPLRELQPMLERLNAGQVDAAALRTISVQTVGSESVAPTISDDVWPVQLKQIRAAIAELEQSHPDAVVLLPVVLESATR